jgi:hypothetical protein
MAVIAGTITGVSHVRSKTESNASQPARKAYLVTASFGAYNGAADTASITGVGAAILARTRNGKTVTLRGAMPAAAGKDTNNQDVYLTGTAVQALTVSTDDLTVQLSDRTGTELTSATAARGVDILVIVDET